MPAPTRLRVEDLSVPPGPRTPTASVVDAVRRLWHPVRLPHPQRRMDSGRVESNRSVAGALGRVGHPVR